MDPHFYYAVTNRLAVPKIATFDAANTLDYPTFATQVFQSSQPFVENSRAEDRIHQGRVYLIGYNWSNISRE